MESKVYGSRVWFFPDGDLPLPGDKEPKGHESLVILNPNPVDATVQITVFYEDKDPDKLDQIELSAQRVRCIRLDKPIGNYRIPFGQYALKVESTTGVICQIGRMDITQPNLAYYTVMGFPAAPAER